VLHVTSGDHAAARIRAMGVGGEVLAWQDVLHEGPVPAGLDLAALTAVRARFIGARGWEDEAIALAMLTARDARLAATAGEDEVALWFEADLYDQLQLLQLLDWFAEPARRPAKLTVMLSGASLPALDERQLRELFFRRRAVPEGVLQAGRRAWAAFRDPDPRALEALLADDEMGAIPGLTEALRRHLEEFPSVADGLSRSERQLLEAVAAGAPDLRAAFVAAHHEREDPVFLGDTVFADYAVRLGGGPHPLVTLAGGAPIVAPGRGETATFWAARAYLTQDGLDVLEGRADAVALRGIDRWLGGVHLTPGSCWRWDHVAGALVPG